MNLSANFSVLDKVSLPGVKKDKIQKILQGLEVSYEKNQIIRSSLENSERLLALKKTMESGLTSSDIEVFSNVLMVIIPKFQANTIIDKIVSVQPAKTPYPVIYYIDWVFGDDYTDSARFDEGAGQVYAENENMQDTRTLTYGMVDELVRGRRIKAKVHSKSITCQIRRINAEWTLESIVALASVMGLENASSFVDQRLTNTIYSKLKDEVEFSVINEMWKRVPAANTDEFELTPAGFVGTPTELTEYRKGISNMLENLSAKVFRVYGVKPNWLIIGPDGYNLLNREKMQMVVDPKQFIGAVGRFYLGVFDMAWNVLYDPWMPGMLMGCNYPENEIYSAVFSPFLVGNTPPITEADANTYRIIYRVDAFDVVLANTLCKVTFK